MRLLHPAGALVLAAALSGCAMLRPADPLLVPADVVEEVCRVDAAPVREVDPTAIYEEVSFREGQFETGIELIVGGKEVLGERRIASATVALRAAVGDCAGAPDCDMEFVLDAFERLMTQQGIELKRQASRIDELEIDTQADVEREPGTAPFEPVLPATHRPAFLLRGADFRDVIEVNGPIRVAIEDWLTWMRPMLVDSWIQYQFLRPQMAPVYETAGLPEALLFGIMATESGGRVHAYSRAGAAGPLQFIRATGRRYGLGVVDGFDMRLDPTAATEANVAYLSDLLAEFDGNVEQSIASYNAGERRVRALRRELGPVSIWDSRFYYALPRETREYVPRVLGAAWLFLHPERYGVRFPSIDTTTIDLVLERDAALGELTVCLGQEYAGDGWFRTLRNLNPRRKPADRISAGETIVFPGLLLSVYRERCLAGSVVEVAGELHEASYPPEPELIRYPVRRGDTLARIARKHGCASTHEIAAINGIRPPRYVIRTGQMLRIPSCR